VKNIGRHTLQVMKTASWYNDWIFSIIEPFLGEEILEIGAGIGVFTEMLARRGVVTAIDIDRSYLKKLKGIEGERIKLGFGDIEKGKYYFKNSKFDSVVCLNVLEHIGDEKRALKNMIDLLRVNGKLILLVPAHGLLFSKFDERLGHYRRYLRKDVKNMLEDLGFAEIEVFYFNWLAAIGWLIFVKIGKKEMIPSDKVSYFNRFGKVFLWPEKFIHPPFGLSVIAVANKK